MLLLFTKSRTDGVLHSLTGDRLYVCRPGQDWYQDGHPTHWPTTG